MATEKEFDHKLRLRIWGDWKSMDTLLSTLTGKRIDYFVYSGFLEHGIQCCYGRTKLDIRYFLDEEDVDAFVLVYDVGNQASFEAVDHDIGFIKWNWPHTLLWLIGNLPDSEHKRHVTKEAGRRKAEIFSMLFIETDARNKEDVKLAMRTVAEAAIEAKAKRSGVPLVNSKYLALGEPREKEELLSQASGGTILADVNTDQEISAETIRLEGPHDIEPEHDNAPITQEHLNHTRICNAVGTVCADALREILLTQMPPGYPDFHQLLLAKEAALRGMGTFRPEQISILYPDPQNRCTGTVVQFDVSLLYELIRSISAVVPPGTGWGQPPDDNPRDTSLGASVERIRRFRNKNVGHSVDYKVDEQTFENTWDEITQTTDDIENVIGDKGYKTALRERKNQTFTLEEARKLQRKFKEVESETPNTSKLPAEILRLDSKSIELYKKALKEGKEKDYSIRIMVTGPYGVGKSTFTKRLLRQVVDIGERNSTDGIDVHVKKCKVSLETAQWTTTHTDAMESNIVQRLAKILVNTREEDKLDTLGPNYTGPPNDVAEDDSEATDNPDREHKMELTENDKENYPNQKSIDSEVLYERKDSNTGNIDSVNVVQESSESSRLDDQESLMRDLKNLVSDANKGVAKEEYADVSVWDFGGQFVFYTTHQMFLSHRAIYILIFNMSQHIGDVVIDDETYFDCSGSKSLKIEEFLDIWLTSIHGHSKSENPQTPPVILVGTHADELNPDDRGEKTEAIFDAIRHRFADKDVSLHFIDEDFGLDNTIADPELEKLRHKIMEVAKLQPQWGEEKPAKWIPLEKLLEEMRVQGVKILSHLEIEQFNQSLPVPITSNEELELFLRFQHETANIIYVSVPELQSKIVLIPQFLVNALKSVITTEMFCKKKPHIYGEWLEFRRKGILKASLLDAVWNTEENRQFRENREHILALMEHLNIIARPVLHAEDGENRRDYSGDYFVPCVLKESPPQSIFDAERFITTPRLCLKLENVAFPSAVFNRLLVGCMQSWPVAKCGKTYHIYCGCGQFDVDDQHRLTLSFHSNVVVLRITMYGEINRHPSAKTCREVYSTVKQALERIGKCLSLELKFEEYVQCPGSLTHTVDCMHSVEKLQSRVEFPCHEQDSGVIIVQSCDLLKYWFPAEDTECKTLEQARSDPLAPETTDIENPKVTENDTNATPKVEAVNCDVNDTFGADIDEEETLVTQEHINHTRVCNALWSVCTDALREVLLRQVPAGYHNIYDAISANKKKLTKEANLRKEQLDLIFPDPHNTGTIATVDQFDLTLLYALIRNISSVQEHVNGWGKQPNDNPRDKCLGANVERIRICRNKISGHSVDGKLDDQCFNDYWEEIRETIDDIETTIGDKGFKNALERWKQQDITPQAARVLKNKFRNYQARLQEDMQPVAETLKRVGEVITTLPTLQTLQTLQTKVEKYTNKK